MYLVIENFGYRDIDGFNNDELVNTLYRLQHLGNTFVDQILPDLLHRPNHQLSDGVHAN